MENHDFRRGHLSLTQPYSPKIPPWKIALCFALVRFSDCDRHFHKGDPNELEIDFAQSDQRSQDLFVGDSGCRVRIGYDFLEVLRRRDIGGVPGFDGNIWRCQCGRTATRRRQWAVADQTC
jgi:hypothetical protein